MTHRPTCNWRYIRSGQLCARSEFAEGVRGRLQSTKAESDYNGNGGRRYRVGGPKLKVFGDPWPEVQSWRSKFGGGIG